MTANGLREELALMAEKTPIADTHEHIVEERVRIKPGDRYRLDDIGVLFSHYLDSDLAVAGMPAADVELLLKRETPPDRKWELVRPWWPHTRSTGYGLCLREALSAVFGEEDITDSNWQRINDAIRAQIEPGYYRRILTDIARIDHCQVNSLEAMPFCETQYPDLLMQDLSILPMCGLIDVPCLGPMAGIEARTLTDWHRVIDWCLERFAPRAVAVKTQVAYFRGLDFAQVTAEEAAPIFPRYVEMGRGLPAPEMKALQDHLFHYCVRRATECRLPVKLHTGIYAGEGYMPLHRLRHNAGDMCLLCQAHPDARFVFMHITYPYQSEAIAVAKHYRNAWIDMCWAWIINPAACVRFLKEFLMAAPANKVLTFGGDFGPVEMVPGHARIARRGIATALAQLVEEGWVARGDLPALVERLMFRNAWDLFDILAKREALTGTA
jgi:uncharacterized protein